MSRRTEIAYKAERMDEVAQHAEVQDHILTVNAAVAWWKLVFLSREACGTRVLATESGGGSNGDVTLAGVSKSHSSPALGRRAERKERERSLMDWSPR